MGYRAKPNCRARDDFGKCHHPALQRKGWRRIFGRPTCVFDMIRFGPSERYGGPPDPSCDLQDPYPRPAGPPPSQVPVSKPQRIG